MANFDPSGGASTNPFLFGPSPVGFVGPTVGAPKTASAPLAKAPAKTTPAAPISAKKIPNRATGPSVGSSPTGVISPTAPVAPSVDEWLANDAAYQSQASALEKAWADYQAQSGQSADQYKTDYASKVDELGKTRALAGQDLESDYASRGMLNSGLYAKAFNDYSTEYDNRQKQLATGLSDFLANLATQSQNYKSEQDLTSEKAKQDAIARRAASLGL